MKILIKLLFCLAFLFSVALHSQTKPSLFETLGKYTKEYDFYGAMRFIEANYADYQNSNYDEQSMYFQLLATMYAFNGVYDSALVAWDKIYFGGIAKQPFSSPKDNISSDDSIFQSLIAVDAKKYVLQQAKANRILCFNEAHTYPRNRTFIKQLLKDLSNEGYHYFAIEALSNDSVWLTYGNSPHRDVSLYTDEGYYIRESCYAELLREAIRCGYQIVGYDNRGGGWARDSLQAVCIVDILKQDTNAKIVVLAGHEHISKKLPRRLFDHLSKMTTEPILSIGQDRLREHATTRYEAAEYLAILEEYTLKDYIVLVDSVNLKPWDLDGFYDFEIIYPRTYYINGRPNWLYDNGNKKAIKLKNIKKDGIVKVYYANEYEQMRPSKDTSSIIKRYVPADQIVIENVAANKEYFAVLPAGKFVVLCCDTEGKTYDQYTLKVENSSR